MMRKGWIDTSLDEVCQFKGGTGFKEHLQGKKSGLYPFIKVSDMTLEGNEKFIVHSNNWIDENDIKEMGVNLMPRNSVVFAKVGAALKLNKRRILTRPTAIDNNMMAAIPNVSKIDTEYLYYFMLTQDLGRFCQESAVPSVNQQHMAEIFISLPPLVEQKKIAAILRTWDDAIEKYNHLITQKLSHKSFLATKLFNSNNVVSVPLGSILETVSTRGKQLQTDQYETIGKLPIIDQGQEFIVGYTNQDICPVSDVPVVIFGDHTRIIKYVDFPFVAGADGTKVIKPNTTAIDRMYFYHLINHEVIRVCNLGYSRHFKGLKELDVYYHKDMAEQKKVAQVLSDADLEISFIKKQQSIIKSQKRGLMQKLLTGAWPVQVSDKEAA
jgi:type I restriction enzyme S subunit